MFTTLKHFPFISALIVIGVIVTDVRAEKLPVQISEQLQWDWCWTAASLSILNRYSLYPGIDVFATGQGQCALANQSRTNNTVDCCTSPTSCNYLTPSMSTVESILGTPPYSLGTTVLARTLTDTEIATQINTNRRPILAGLRQKNFPTGMKHMVVIIAVDTSGSLLTVMDPSTYFSPYNNFHYGTIASNDLRSGTGINNLSQWEWFETMTIDTSPPQDVNLRYSYSESAYDFMAFGNLVAGPDFTVKNSATQTFVVPVEKTVRLVKGFSALKGCQLDIVRE